MNTGLEYNLALRVRSATRWVEGQQGMLPDDGDGAVDGFGRAMLVRTGALPSPYTGAEGVAGTTIDQQPTGANVAGVAVLIKDLNGGKLAANTTYNARLGGFLTGKALYFVEAAAAGGTVGSGLISSQGYIIGDDGVNYGFVINNAWWNRQANLSCRFRRTGTAIGGREGAQVIHVESKLIFSPSTLLSDSQLIGLYTVYNGPFFAFAADPLRLTAHIIPYGRLPGQSGPYDLFLSASYFSFSEPYGNIVMVKSATWPVAGVSPLDLVAYSPFWNFYRYATTTSGTLGAPLGAPLGG